MPEQSVLRLSDAYESKSEELDLELRIRFININPGYNEEIVEKSPTLYQYVKFVDIVRKYQQEMPFPEAVEKAIDECIKKGILAEFLRKNRAEVLRVSIFEYDEEKHMRMEREESRENGIAIGIVKTSALFFLKNSARIPFLIHSSIAFSTASGNGICC